MSENLPEGSAYGNNLTSKNWHFPTLTVEET